MTIRPANSAFNPQTQTTSYHVPNQEINTPEVSKRSRGETSLSESLKPRTRSPSILGERSRRPSGDVIASALTRLTRAPEGSREPSATKQKGAAEGALSEFFAGMNADDKALVVVGGGTAALTYLSTIDFDEKFTHVAVVGDQGYWSKVGHRLAQPHHILALPHEQSAEFVDPSKHDALGNILPHDNRSAYVHSNDYQDRLAKLGEYTVNLLQNQGMKVFVAGAVSVEKITKHEESGYKIATGKSGQSIVGHKVVVATGPAPGRTLASRLLPKSSAADRGENSGEKLPQILSYDDILTSTTAKRIKGKDVMVYGGGPTAAWAMEVGKLNAKSSAWVARKGFGVAEEAGPRVGAIIEGSRDSQITGEIESIEYLDSNEAGEEQKLRVNVSHIKPDGTKGVKPLDVDYLVNSTGQDAYGAGGLHDILSAEIKRDLRPIPDRNQVSGVPDTMLGFSTDSGDLQIIGAAAASYQDDDRGLNPGRLASETLPRSGKIGITVGGVVASVTALTDHMPITQDPTTGEMKVTGLNLHVMNATQLAVYLTGAYPDTPAGKINSTVKEYLVARSNTEFGLSDTQLKDFMKLRLGPLPLFKGAATE